MRTKTTTTTRRRNTFTKRDGSTYRCDSCGRMTRHTGAQSLGSKLCPQCWDLAGIENEISDGYTTFEASRDNIQQLIADIIAKGGNAANAWPTFVEQLQPVDAAVAAASVALASGDESAENKRARVEVGALVDVVAARLNGNGPQDSQDWEVIAAQLRDAFKLAAQRAESTTKGGAL